MKPQETQDNSVEPRAERAGENAPRANELSAVCNAGVILIIDAHTEGAAELKELLEFMVLPEVRIAAPDRWKNEIGDNPIDVIFLAGASGRGENDVTLRELREHLPDVPIVLLGGGDESGGPA